MERSNPDRIGFPLYAASREVIKKYTPFLGELDLTYTQYLVLAVLWERNEISQKELGQALFLNSSTLTPVLKGMEQRALIARSRSESDERVVLVRLLEQGRRLQGAAADIPARVAESLPLGRRETAELSRLLGRVLSAADKEGEREAGRESEA